jgi:hypothetical protein
MHTEVFSNMRHDYRIVVGSPEGQEHLENLELVEIKL